MKQVLHLCSKIRGLFSASQCSDVGYDCRLTVVRPSFDCRSAWLKLCSVLAILFIVGVGYAWGTTSTWVSEDEAISAKNGVTITMSNTAKGDYYQVYKSSDLVVSVSSGSITSITITCTKEGTTKYGPGGIPNGSGYTASASYTGTWTGSASSVTLTASNNQVRITQIVVETSGGSSVATPTFSVAAGTYTSVQSVTISCATAGSTIYYTTDGTTPTSSSTVYSSAVSISSSCTLKAIAKKGSDYSSVASASYTINIPYTVSFSTGTGNPTVDDVTEESQGEGIELPDGVTPDCSSDGWVFAGWASTSITEQNNAPRLYMPGDGYYPESDETLYAVYRKLTSGTSTATFTASDRSNLTQISDETYSPGWWYHTASGVEFYIKSYGYYSSYSSFDIWKSWALIDAHTNIKQVVITNYSTYTINSVELNDDEDAAGGSATMTGTTTQTITCSGDVTQLYLNSPGSGDSYFTAFTVTYYNAKYNSNPTCASCDANPTVTAASQKGSFFLDGPFLSL